VTLVESLLTFAFNTPKTTTPEHQSTRLWENIVNAALLEQPHRNVYNDKKVFLRDIWKKCPKEPCSVTIRVQHLVRNTQGNAGSYEPGDFNQQEKINKGPEPPAPGSLQLLHRRRN
jgi:hypothetical protein